MKYWIIYFLFLPIFVSAQINESDSIKVKTSLSFTGLWQSGNVETLILRGRADLSVRPLKKWVYKSTNSYIYQAFDKVKADSDFLSLNFLYFNPDKRFYPQVLAFFSTNFRREIDRRFLIGTGGTYQIIKGDKNWLKTSLTIEYEDTNFKNDQFNKPQYNTSNSINTFRCTIWMSGKYELFKKIMVFKHESYYQPSLDDHDNYRWQIDLSLEFPIWKYLSFKINYLRTFESIVILGQKREDQFLTFGLTLQNF